MELSYIVYGVDWLHMPGPFLEDHGLRPRCHGPTPCAVAGLARQL